MQRALAQLDQRRSPIPMLIHKIDLMLTMGMTLLLFVGAKAERNLIKEGYKLVVAADPDDEDFISGGSRQPAQYYNSGQCNSISYRDNCPNVPGTRFRFQSGIFVVNGDQVTRCTKVRSESQCHSSITNKFTFSTDYEGATTVYNLVKSDGDIAVLAGIDGGPLCENACKDKDGGTIKTIEDKDLCFATEVDGWLSVDSGYDEECTTIQPSQRQPCLELVLEPTERCIWPAATFVPYEGDDCTTADKSRSIYISKEPYDPDDPDRSNQHLYLFYELSTKGWIVSGPHSGCHSVTDENCLPGAERFSEAWWDAGDEPYLDTGDTLRCWAWSRTQKQELNIRCNKLHSSDSGGRSAESKAQYTFVKTVFAGALALGLLLSS